MAAGISAYEPHAFQNGRTRIKSLDLSTSSGEQGLEREGMDIIIGLTLSRPNCLPGKSSSLPPDRALDAKQAVFTIDLGYDDRACDSFVTSRTIRYLEIVVNVAATHNETESN